MPPRPPLDPAQLKLLRGELDLLHLLFHRNKNQHRLLKWWQWIATLRRNLSKLLFEHDLITIAKTTPGRDIAVTKYKERLVFMRKVVIPGAYTAFGTVVAMKNFAPLGMVLTGVLARVWKVIRPTERELEEERELEREVVASVGVDSMADSNTETGAREGYSGTDSGVVAGVVISRAAYEEGLVVQIQAGRKASTEGKAPRRVGDRGEKVSMIDTLLASSREEKKGDSELANPPGQKSNSAASGSVRAKQTKKERTGTLQATSASTGRTPKRKLDSEPGKRRERKKKKGDDLDALFSGLF